MAPTVETEDLSRSFDGDVALDGLALTAEPGEVLALLGPNGAGKTTTIRLLNGVLKPDRGRATVLGMDPAIQGDDVRRVTGVLTENAGLDDRLTARENLVVTARIRGFDMARAGKRSDELLERFGMADRANSTVQGFSTGQRKRLALARALLHDPEILFLDEPTSGLDPAATRDVVELIGSLAAEHKRTVILCTHFLGEAGRLANRMAVLHRGHLQAFGTPHSLAAELWEGLEVDLELGAAAPVETLDLLGRIDGVLTQTATPTGARLRVEDRAALPKVVATLVGHEITVYAVVPLPPTLEDVYFAIEARIAEREREAGR